MGDSETRSKLQSQSSVRSLASVCLPALVVVLLLAGCATNARGYWAVLAVSTPYHESDWIQLQKTLKAEGIACIEGGSSFGAADLLVDSREFERARRIGERLISGESRTIRLSKDPHGGVLEVYENGQKIREDTVLIEKTDE